MRVARYSSFSAAALIASLLGGVLLIVQGSAGGRAACDGGGLSLEDLAWMEGAWQGEALGGLCEEHWSSPRGGTMMGMFRLIADGKTKVTEYLLIEESKEAITYRFKHIAMDWKPWEKEALFFRLVEAKEGLAIFACPKVQQPRRLEYRRENDSLNVRVFGPAGDDGKADFFDVPLKLMKHSGTK